MNPTHSGPNWQLHQADALEFLEQLPAESAAAIITDPPYSSGGLFTTERKADPVDKYCQNSNARGRRTFSGDSRDQRSFAFWCTLWLRECLRVAEPSAYLLCFTDWRQLPTTTDAIQAAGWTWRGIVPWNKGRGSRAPHKGFFRHQCEYVAWGTKGRVPKLTDRGPFDGIVDAPNRKNDKHHITGKPTAVLRHLVQCAAPGGTIVDPFSGSATTGVAALLEGRRFIGADHDAGHNQIGAARLEAAARGELLHTQHTRQAEEPAEAA